MLLRLFGMIVASFYDDFTQVDIEALVDSADDCIVRLLKLSGWDVTVAKLLPFRAQLDESGVRFRCRQSMRQRDRGQ